MEIAIAIAIVGGLGLLSMVIFLIGVASADDDVVGSSIILMACLFVALYVLALVK